MKIEELAHQLFDMWQLSLEDASNDPSFHAKMLDLVAKAQQETAYLSGDPPVNGHSKSVNGAAAISSATQTSYAPNQQSSQPHGTGDLSVSQLAQRVEECEQRLHVMETVLRSWLDSRTEAAKRAEQGKPKTRTDLPEGLRALSKF